MLNLNNIEVIYNDVILVLKGLSLTLEQGQIAALLGTNGAGKSTTLKAISGLLKPEDGKVTDGSIDFLGDRIDTLAAEEVVRRGIFQVMEGRRVFEHLNIEDNLLAGAYTRKDRGELKGDIERVYDDADYVGSLVTDGLAGRPTDYAGNHIQPDGWWGAFFSRHPELFGVVS